MVKGKIHSFESMGLVDGPGIRTVVFFQGCPLRCAYCHNPDTWSTAGGTEYTAEDLMKKILRFKPYFKRSGGGVTFSGGEPLLQSEFLLEMLKKCRENGINTALDTSGYGLGNYEEILKNVDLVILDIKHTNDEDHLKLTGKDRKGSDEFIEALNKENKKVWVRHVVVPGITDSEEHLINLSKIIKKIKNVEKVELLPYHTMAIEKYKKLGIPYKLEEKEPMDKKRTKELEHFLKDLLKEKTS
ncbi:MAG: pyruvate formate lyase-activating protein [Bacillota bacterium]|nr:pyruvate formate lyase-activating protein [Bacillota bacterium]